MRRRWYLTDSGMYPRSVAIPIRTPCGLEAEADRIHGVVGNAEALHFDVADLKARAGLKGLHYRFGPFPVDRRTGEPCQVKGLFQSPRQHGQAGYVI